MRSLIFVVLSLLSSGLAAADFVLNSTRNGNYSLEIDGEIRSGDTGRLALIFSGKKSFPVTTRIETAGGSIDEAIQLGQLFRRGHLSVISTSNCDTPCFLALVGGISRTLSEDLVLIAPDKALDEISVYLTTMGVSASLVEEFSNAGATISISVSRFNKDVGERPAELDAAFVSHCGQQSEKERDDFRALQAYRFLESLQLLLAETGRVDELLPMIEKYKDQARDAESLSIEYRQLLLDQWQQNMDCRKRMLEDAQKVAIQQLMANTQSKR